MMNHDKRTKYTYRLLNWLYQTVSWQQHDMYDEHILYNVINQLLCSLCITIDTSAIECGNPGVSYKHLNSYVRDHISDGPRRVVNLQLRFVSQST